MKPNLDTVELCLTYRCNVKCNNCSNLCTQAPIKGDLTIEQVNRFIFESILEEHNWKTITIHGGEPTLHPDFDKICETLIHYKEQMNPECNIWVVSNGNGEYVTQKLINAKKIGVGLGISPKVGTNRDPHGNAMLYVPVNNSPKDLGKENSAGCFQMTDCGVCYNYLGWFLCSPAAAAARVFDYKPMAGCLEVFLKMLEGVEDIYPKHCEHCGFACEQPRMYE